MDMKKARASWNNERWGWSQWTGLVMVILFVIWLLH